MISAIASTSNAMSEEVVAAGAVMFSLLDCATVAGVVSDADCYCC